MGNGETGPRPWVGALTAVWIGGLMVVLWWIYTILITGWAEGTTGGGPSAATQAEASLALEVLAGVAVGGPLIIALLASRARRKVVALVYGVLALVLGVVSAPVWGGAIYDHVKPQPRTSDHYVCQELSGGGNDNHCPGG